MQLNSNIKENLLNIGFKEKEALVYLYLLETGGAYPSSIAKDIKINRTTVYQILNTLSVRGFVSEIEKKKKLFYYPESANKFLRALKESVYVAENNYEKAQKVFPLIEGLLKTNDFKPKVTFYEGKSEVINAYLDQIDGKGNFELLAFANTDKLKDFLPWKTFRQYILTKEKKKITARGIVPFSSIKNEFIKNTHTGIKEKYKPVIKYVDNHQFFFPGEIIIYGDKKVQFVKFDDIHPISVIIEDKVIHDFMKMIFELSWKGIL